MRGDEGVIQQLNEALKAELTAIVQYIVQADMCHNWGYDRLGHNIQKQANDKMTHVASIVERILYLEGTPNVGVMPVPRIGANIKAQLVNDLSSELEAVSQYNSSAARCLEVGDHTSGALFKKMAKDEEEHADFLDGQLAMIGKLGSEKYLAQQVQGEDGVP